MEPATRVRRKDFQVPFTGSFLPQKVSLSARVGIAVTVPSVGTMNLQRKWPRATRPEGVHSAFTLDTAGKGQEWNPWPGYGSRTVAAVSEPPRRTTEWGSPAATETHFFPYSNFEDHAHCIMVSIFEKGFHHLPVVLRPDLPSASLRVFFPLPL